jgi:hypothetical protein
MIHDVHSRVLIGKYFDLFLFLSELKQEEALSLLLFNCTLEYGIRKVLCSQKGLYLSYLIQVFVCAHVDTLVRI